MRIFKNVALVLLVLVGVLFVTIGVVFNVNISPVDKNNSKEITVIIPAGSTKQKVGEILEKEGLIRSASFFNVYLKLFETKDFKAATYKLNKSMALKEIINILEKGNNESDKDEEIKITFKEGINIRQLIKVIVSNTNNTEEDVLNLINDEKYLNSLIENYWFIEDDIKNSKLYYSIEGYLFPDTYIYANKDVKVEDIFAKMLKEMDKKLSPFKEEIEKSGYTVHEILTLASVIEKEGKTKDFKMISQVFHNRLNRSNKLESCATSYYGMRMDFDEIGIATNEMMQNVNVYNTYLLSKLPLGPIALPGLKAIEAALYPEEGDNLFFLSDARGNTYFFKTINEQTAYKNQLIKEGNWYRK